MWINHRSFFFLDMQPGSPKSNDIITSFRFRLECIQGLLQAEVCYRPEASGRESCAGSSVLDEEISRYSASSFAYGTSSIWCWHFLWHSALLDDITQCIAVRSLHEAE